MQKRDAEASLFFIHPSRSALQRRATLAMVTATMTAMLAAKAHRFAVEHLLLLRREHGVQVVQGRQARFHAGRTLLLALDLLLQALRRGQGGQPGVAGTSPCVRALLGLAGRQEGGEGRFLLRGQLEFGSQPGGMLGLPFGALGADGLAVAAFLRLHGGSLGHGGTGDTEGGQGDQDMFVEGVHFRSLSVCESVDCVPHVSIYHSLHGTYHRE
jgi:hypothetical protein